jgi:hypothetical protein
MTPLRKDKKKATKAQRLQDFTKVHTNTLHLVKPLSLCVFVAEEGFSEWTQYYYCSNRSENGQKIIVDDFLQSE